MLREALCALQRIFILRTTQTIAWRVCLNLESWCRVERNSCVVPGLTFIPLKLADLLLDAVVLPVRVEEGQLITGCSSSNRVSISHSVSCLNFVDLMNLQSARLLCAWSQAEQWMATLQIFLPPGVNSHLLHIANRSLLAQPPGKPAGNASAVAKVALDGLDALSAMDPLRLCLESSSTEWGCLTREEPLLQVQPHAHLPWLGLGVPMGSERHENSSPGPILRLFHLPPTPSVPLALSLWAHTLCPSHHTAGPWWSLMPEPVYLPLQCLPDSKHPSHLNSGRGSPCLSHTSSPASA